MIRSIVGSLAKFMKRTVLSMVPFCSKSDLKNLAVSMLTPIAANTNAKFSSTEVQYVEQRYQDEVPEVS